MSAFRVAIAGGGITGPATALLLAERGHHVTLFEKLAAEPQAGSGLLLQPAGVAVLRALQSSIKLDGHGSGIHRVVAKDEHGATLASLSYAERDAGSHGLAMHRGELSLLLMKAAAAGSRIELRKGVRIVELFEEAREVKLIDSSGTIHAGFDVVAICDGANSHLRDGLPLKTHLEWSAWGVFSFTARAPATLDSSTLLQRYLRAEDVVGLLPIGIGGDGIPRVSFFWNCRPDAVAALKARGIDAWRAHLNSFCPESAEILEGLQSFDELNFSTHVDVTMERCHTSRIVVMGDAAHAMSPELGLGATMGLLDASALATALEEVVPQQVPSALETYESHRAAQLAYYQNLSRLVSMTSRNSLSPVSRSRMMLLRTAAWVPLVRRRLLESMSGYARAA